MELLVPASSTEYRTCILSYFSGVVFEAAGEEQLEAIPTIRCWIPQASCDACFVGAKENGMMMSISSRHAQIACFDWLCRRGLQFDGSGQLAFRVPGRGAD